MSEGSRSRRRGSNASDRRPLRFWEPFNKWWRGELERTGKRATSDEIARWYAVQSNHAWGPEKPSLQETRTHAKCLRSVSSVRDYFREYRAKKKHEQSELDMDDEEEDEVSRRSRSSNSKHKSRHTKSMCAGSAAESPEGSAMQQSYMACADEQSYWGSAYFDGGASGISTAAAAAQCHGIDSQGALEYAQQMAALQMACFDPSTMDAYAWVSYQQATSAAQAVNAIKAEGPMVPSALPTQAPDSQLPGQQQPDVLQAGSSTDIATAATAASHLRTQWQPPLEDQNTDGLLQPPEKQGQEQHNAAKHDALVPPGTRHVSPGSFFPYHLQLPAASSPFHVEAPAIPSGVQQHIQSNEWVAASAATGTKHGLLECHQANSSARLGTSRPQQDLGKASCETRSPAGTRPQPLLGSQQHAAAVQPHVWSGAGHHGCAQDCTAAQFVDCAGPTGLQQHHHQHQKAAQHGISTGSLHQLYPAQHQAAFAGTPHGVFPSSLLAALPQSAALPGCPGHSTVDSILQHLDFGEQPPQHSEAGKGGPLYHVCPRLSISSLLDEPNLRPPMVAASRRLSQPQEVTALPHQRLSLYAMGSGALDMLTDGLDLDAFLGPGEVALPAGDAIAPVAPGSRVSMRWLRASCRMQVPEHWQQHMQALQDAPFRGSPGNASAEHATAQPCLRLGVAPDPVTHTCTEVSGAALAAEAQPMEDLKGGGPAATTQAVAQEAPSVAVNGPQAAAAPEVPEATAHPAASCKKRPAEEDSTCLAARTAADRAEQRPRGAKGKRLCAGMADEKNVASATEGSAKPQGFKFVLDLASPRPQAAPGLQHQQDAHSNPVHDDTPCMTPPDAAGVPPLEQGLQQLDDYQRCPMVLDLRPDELGATSENTLATPQAGSLHVQLLTSQTPAAGLVTATEQQGASLPNDLQQVPGLAGQAHSQRVVLPPLLSPKGQELLGAAAHGTWQCGPATAASTTGAPPRGPNGAILPAPAMAQVAVMPLPPGIQQQRHLKALIKPGARVVAKEPCTHLLPAMHEIERMI